MPDRIRLALLFVVVLACFAARVTGAFAAHVRKTHVHHVAHKVVTRAPKAVHKAVAHAHSTKAVPKLVAQVQAKAVHKVVVHTHHHVSRATATAREQQKVVHFARRLMGIRYTYGGTSPSTGFDCSGFTRFVYAHFGITLPHYSVAQFSLGRRVSMAGLRPGDLLFFDGLGHVGLYVGSGRFIHAPHTGTDVQISPLSEYSSVYDGARRII